MKGTLDQNNGVWKHHADAVISQVLVQNTWVTVLDTTKNVKINFIETFIPTNTESLEVKVTIDSVALAPAAPVSTTAGSYYSWYKLPTQTDIMGASTTTLPAGFAVPLEGKNVKIEMRKTTAAAGDTITAKVTYDTKN